MNDERTKRDRLDETKADEVAGGFVLNELDTSQHEAKRQKSENLDKMSGAALDPSASQVLFTADFEKRCKSRSARPDA